MDILFEQYCAELVLWSGPRRLEFGWDVLCETLLPEDNIQAMLLGGKLCARQLAVGNFCGTTGNLEGKYCANQKEKMLSC